VLGAGIALMIDYNQSLELDEAIARCQALDGEGLEWIEEPIAATDLEGCARIAELVETPIQIGENFNGPIEMREAIAKRASDFVMPDVQYIHGVTGWLEAAELARAANLPMSSHTFVEASAHLLAATPTRTGSKCSTPRASAACTACPARRRCPPLDSPGIGIEWMRTPLRGTEPSVVGPRGAELIIDGQKAGR
jgi:mandelate racemase